MTWSLADQQACKEKIDQLAAWQDRHFKQATDAGDLIGRIDGLCQPDARRQDGEALTDTERTTYWTNLKVSADKLMGVSE